MDCILTVVDASAFAPDLFSSEAALAQIMYGDILLLNKTNLVGQSTVRRLEWRLREIKAGARILRSERGQVTLPLILDVGDKKPDAYTNLVREEMHQTQGDHDAPHHHDHSHDHEAHEHHHHHSARLENDDCRNLIPE